MAKKKTYFDKYFYWKNDNLYFTGEQMKLKLQCSFLGCTWQETIKFPKKFHNMIKGDYSETYFTLLEFVDDVAKLKVNECLTMRAYRDEKDSAMIVTRIV